MTSFTDLGLDADLVARLKTAGITDPTPIQAQAIPPAMKGRDVIGLAQTGTGKTAAFGLPLIAALTAAPERPAAGAARSLILAPTRELAAQIADALKPLCEGARLRTQVVTGGASINAQSHRLARGADILVATPGRLIDLMDRRALHLTDTRFLVLDEADQMLDLGFIHALRKIAARLPDQRQTMLFSATMPKQMAELAKDFLTDPVRVEVAPPGTAVDRIRQSVHFVERADKTERLIDLLDAHRAERAIVFGRTKHGSEKLAKQLMNAGFAVAAIHGNKSQGQRNRAIEGFKGGQVRVLVATDVAARGIDIPDVKHVYNYDLPNVPENYVHRIGRTARAGADGAAIAFCTPDEMGELVAIEKAMGTSIPVASGARFAPAKPEPKARPSRPPRRSRPRRPSKGSARQAA
ncbi:DEAD/DEAH box helicase [Wenxinia marina]|uniref:Superfamily II DNA and RNA helicase n=1 Tax=Wenxinia marina DSM 24838 TaxID=1123501 RepID=A0A0D0NPZ8_9RHOB|nr:DEAD/DEAH box helicase [Wenxinia marina]KIQ70345.1 Superfamily II DNA and RNA helicase [Wenxinia marina DSM 24838]GGL53870.1 DEAD/DEAH box helicase [Wenxinia marina]